MDILSLYNAIEDYFKVRPSYKYLYLESFSRVHRGSPYLYVCAKVHHRKCYLHLEWIDEGVFNGYLRLINII